MRTVQIGALLLGLGVLGCTNASPARSCSLPKSRAPRGTPVIAIRATASAPCASAPARTTVPVPASGGTASWKFTRVTCAHGEVTHALEITAAPEMERFAISVSDGKRNASATVAGGQVFSAKLDDLLVEVTAANDVLE